VNLLLPPTGKALTSPGAKPVPQVSSMVTQPLLSPLPLRRFWEVQRLCIPPMVWDAACKADLLTCL